MSLTTRPAPPRATRARLGVIDALRGVAIIAVVLYHLTWDLGSLDLIGVDIGSRPAGKAIAHGIAGTFLFLTGVSLVLAHRPGWRAGAFWRRELELVGYAVLITVVTLLAMPGQFVSFGILHSLAVASVLALPFVWASRAAAVGAVGLAVALPRIVTVPGESRWWSWTGLTEGVQPTVDSAPVLPWFALTLLGVVVMRTLQDSGLDARLAALRTDRGPSRALAFLGRHTLLIYLVHQPVLLGVLHGWLALR